MKEGFTKEVGIRVSRRLRASWLAREFRDAPWGLSGSEGPFVETAHRELAGTRERRLSMKAGVRGSSNGGRFHQRSWHPCFETAPSELAGT